MSKSSDRRVELQSYVAGSVDVDYFYAEEAGAMNVNTTLVTVMVTLVHG